MSSGASQDSRVHRLADEFLARYRHGEEITVEQFCEEHPDQSDELKGLLTAMAMLEGFPVSASSSDHLAASVEELTESDPDEIGEYRIVRRIGHGGMGVVYDAEHTSLGRRVALKVLPKQFARSASARLRFEREARAAARMHHTNIVPIFEVGQADGYLFYAMQLIRGNSLDHSIHQPTTSAVPGESSIAISLASSSTASAQREFFRSIAKIGLQAAEALEYAHDRGIVHRDIKPSNLIQDDTGVVWLTDFGLAKHDDEGMTKTGEYLGTLRYMSPERFRGECGERADIYSLGLTLYELLTHRPAFATTDQLELIHQIKEKQPARLRSLDPRIPKDLETIVTKAIEKEPARRYQTAAEMADDLRRLLDDQPIVARRATLKEQLLLWRRRNPTLAASVAALLFVLIVGIAATTWKWREADQQRSLAQQNTRVARWQNYRANMATASSALQTHDAESLQSALKACEPEFRGWEWHYFNDQLAPWSAELDGSLEGYHYVLGTLFRDQGSTLVNNRLTDQGASRSLTFDVHTRKRLRDTKDLHSPLGIYQAATERSTSAELSLLSHTGHFRSQQADGKLRLQWLAEKTHEVEKQVVLAYDNGRVSLPAFSPDDQLIAYWCADRTVRVWETATGKLISVLEDQKPLVTAIEFSPDGTKILGCGFLDQLDWPANSCVVWDVLTGRKLLELNKPGLPRVYTHAFDKNGKLLAVGREYPSNSIELWDLDNLTRLAQLKTHDNSIRSLALTGDGSRLAAASFDRTVSIWNLQNFRLLQKLKGPAELPAKVYFNRDESSVLVVAQSGATRVWDTTSFRLQDAYMTQSTSIADVAISRDEDLLAAMLYDGKIRLWDLKQQARLLIRSHTSYVYDLQCSPDGTEIASVGWDNTLRIHDVATGKQRKLFLSEDLSLLRLRYSPDGSRVLATTADRDNGAHIYVWKTDASDGSDDTPLVIEHAVSHGRAGEGFGATFSSDGQQIIAGSSEGTLHFWNADTGVQEQVASSTALPPISDVSLSPNNRLILSVGGCLTLWDASTLSTIAKLGEPDDYAYSAIWSADSKFVAAVDTHSAVKLWNIETRQQVAELRHGALIYDAAFSPDGTRLSTACDDNTIRLWDLKTYEQVAVLRQHSSYVHAVDFSPDGMQLISCSGDHSIRIWDTLPASERAPNTGRDTE